MIYDTIIIGGGPGGVAAGIYAARKKLKCALITESIGGQSVVAQSIENWIGTLSVPGIEFAKMLENHLRAHEDQIDILMPEKVEKIDYNEKKKLFTIKTNKKEYQSKTLIYCAGAHRRRLGVPGEGEFAGKGVAYCSTCDAPLFRNKVVGVVGGGNSALESVRDLAPYASKIYLFVRSEKLRGDQTTLDEIEKIKTFEPIMYNTEIKEVFGDNLVKGVKYLDKNVEQVKDLKLDGLFIEIGSIPNTDAISHLVDLDESKEIIVDHRTGQTSHERIWAAGDVINSYVKQSIVAAGDATKAAISVYRFMCEMEKTCES